MNDTIVRELTLNGVEVRLEAGQDAVGALNTLIGKLKPVADGFPKPPEVRPPSRDLDLLDTGFASKVKGVLAVCNKKGHPMRPFFTLRDVWTQARLWRQSRPTHEIQKAIQKLKQEGAPFLAYVLDAVGPQHGRWATNALPGQSWHQWGLAVDCYALGLNGRAAWSASHPSYKVYADTAQEFGLMPGFYWKRKDAVHIQAEVDGVRQTKTWPDIDSAMQKLFAQTA